MADKIISEVNKYVCLLCWCDKDSKVCMDKYF